MKSKPFGRWPWLLMLAALPFSAHAGETFTNIADNSGTIDTFESTPTINNSGTVAFVASYETPGLFDPIVESVLTGDGGALTTVYHNRGTVEYGGHTSTVNYLIGSSINTSGTVAFRYTVNDTYYSAILTANATTVTHIVDNGDAVLGVPGSFTGLGPSAINDAGTVAFWGSVPGGSGIYVKNAAPAGGIIHQAASPGYLGANPAINNSGTVAGELHDASGIDSVFTGAAGGPIHPIATTAADAANYFLYSTPSINDRGVVAYVGNVRTDGSKNIYVQGPDGTTFRYASTGAVDGVDSPFVSLGDHAAISDSGIAYYARLSLGNHGVILRQSSSAQPLDNVVEIGDALFGSTVTGLSANPEINDNGEIVFTYWLATGVSGIAVASPGKLTRQISSGQSYADIRLRSDQGSGNIASLRGGAAADDRTVDMAFVPRSEAPPGAFATFVGDAFTLSGTGDDVFVLQLAYTDADLAAAGVVDEAGLYIGWLDPVNLVGKNAVDGNSPAGGESFFGLSYDAYLAAHGGEFRLGDYGNDPESNTIWAVLNHNSLFVIGNAAVSVPEPSAWALIGLGLCALLLFRKRPARAGNTPSRMTER